MILIRKLYIYLAKISAVALAGSALVVPLAKASETFPSAPIKIVVPFPPGGSVDLMARLFGMKMAERLGRPVIIDNRPGGGTMIGTNYVVRSKPDGHTLLLAVSSAVTNPGLFKNIPYDLQKDLTPVSLLATIPIVSYTHVDFQAKNVQEMLAAATTQQVNMASPGYGTMPGLSTELFLDLTESKAIHVPYNGGAPAMTDTLAGHVQIMHGTAFQGYEHYKAKKINAIAISSEKRHPLYPDVPTYKEQGVDLIAQEWFGLLAPAETPPAVIEKLNHVIKEVVAEKDFSKGNEIFLFVGSSPEQFKHFLEKETNTWIPLIQRLGLTIEK